MNRKEFIVGAAAFVAGLTMFGSDFAELIGDRATVLPPKAWYGATIKLGIGLEGYVTDRLQIQ